MRPVFTQNADAVAARCAVRRIVSWSRCGRLSIRPYHPANRVVAGHCGDRRIHAQRVSAGGDKQVTAIHLFVDVRPGGHRVAVADAGESARRPGIDVAAPDPAGAHDRLAGGRRLGAGIAEQSRAGHRANVPLTTALDAGLGPARRTDSAGLWRRPAGAGTAKAPGVLRMLRVYRDYAHDSNISYGEYGSANRLDIWRRPDWIATERRRCCFRFPVAPGRRETNADKPIR